LAVRILRKIIVFKVILGAIRRFLRRRASFYLRLLLKFGSNPRDTATTHLPRLTALGGLCRRQYARLSAFRSFVSNLANRHLLDFRKICLRTEAHKITFNSQSDVFK